MAMAASAGHFSALEDRVSAVANLPISRKLTVAFAAVIAVILFELTSLNSTLNLSIITVLVIADGVSWSRAVHTYVVRNIIVLIKMSISRGHPAWFFAHVGTHQIRSAARN